jgi:hypothetical protein
VILASVHAHCPSAVALDADAITQVLNEAKRHIVRAFVKRGLLDSIDGEVMLLARHDGGFSVDASVCIGGAAIRGAAIRGAAIRGAAIRGKQGDLILTPCEFIAKIAALVPPPRMHRHR